MVAFHESRSIGLPSDSAASELTDARIAELTEQLAAKQAEFDQSAAHQR